MDLTKANEQPPKTTTPWKKKVLITFLLLAVLAGLAITALFFLPQSAGLLQSLRSSLSEVQQNLPEAPAMLTRMKKEVSITFQGHMIGEKGAIALINDEMVAVGAEIEGVLVMEIKDHSLIIDYQGELIPLTIGQTFTHAVD